MPRSIKYLSVEHIITIHNRLPNIKLGGIRAGGRALLESSVSAPCPVFGHEQYPSLVDKAAVLLHSLVRNHPFNDGNKRTAIHACSVFLSINGLTLRPVADMDIADFVVEVAEGQYTFEEIKEYIVKFYQLNI